MRQSSCKGSLSCWYSGGCHVVLSWGSPWESWSPRWHFCPSFCTYLQAGKCPRQDSAGSQLSFGSGVLVIISEITDHTLLSATVGTRNLPSSPKRFISCFFSKYMMRQIYLIHRDGLRQRKDRKATITWHSEYVKHCFRHSTSFKAHSSLTRKRPF